MQRLAAGQVILEGGGGPVLNGNGHRFVCRRRLVQLDGDGGFPVLLSELGVADVSVRLVVVQDGEGLRRAPLGLIVKPPLAHPVRLSSVPHNEGLVGFRARVGNDGQRVGSFIYALVQVFPVRGSRVVCGMALGRDEPNSALFLEIHVHVSPGRVIRRRVDSGVDGDTLEKTKTRFSDKADNDFGMSLVSVRGKAVVVG